MRGFVESLLTHVVVDANATRVAVISYSNNAETHLNYIRNPKTKCFLSEEMQEIAYKDSEATNIAAALNEARNVLLHSRPNVNKVVIMISDGLATLGGDPIPVGDKLKKDTGAEVFAFGIGKFLKQELQAIATSPSHVYNCKGFKEFKRLARKIRGDPHESNWAYGNTPSCDHLCDSPYKGDPDDPGCCDHHARCSCALLSGMHSCACSPGYFGLKGTWGDCRACPRGTFKSRLEPAGSCVDCPPSSTTAEIASTSIRDCHCKDGYTGDPASGEPCKPVTCPPLQNPTDGKILGTCDNHYGSECFVVCRENYELKDPNSHAMKCMSNGRWSWSAPTCQRIKCHPMIPPRFGKMMCDDGNLTPGKRCYSKCFDGFIFKGSKMRECLSNKMWSGLPTNCIRIECSIPHQPEHGRLLACDSNSKPQYGDTCVFKCNHGYRLVGSPFFKCDQYGNLVDPYGQVHTVGLPYCEDTQPPEIRCPRDRVLQTTRGHGYAVVDWRNENLPEAHDNSGEETLIQSHPPGYATSGTFPIGTKTITFEATDKSGLTSSCEFIVTVVDREPPQVLRCPDGVQVNTTDTSIRVYWDEPVFKDNSNEYFVVKTNHRPGDHFHPGVHNVFYVVRDRSDNAAMCEFQVTVTQHHCPNYAPPINGALACEDWMYGQFCQVQCNQKYDFAMKPAEWYVCNENAKWSTLPEGLPIPWPSCTKTVLPHQLRKMWMGYYYAGDCRDPRAQYEIRMAFLTVFRKKFGSKFCVKERSCSLDMVKVSCGKVIDYHSQQSHRQSSSRTKRDTWKQIPTTAETLEIELDIIIDDESNENVIFDFLDAIENLEWNVDAEFNELLSHAATDGNNNNDENNDLDRDLVLRMITEDIMLVCGVGSELHGKECRLCPFGTYHDVMMDKCSPCAVGFYQDTEGQIDCKACPFGTSTKYIQSTNATECKGLCRDGTYSATGLETCLACPLGTYQDEERQTNCIACPTGYTTETEASGRPSDCRQFCTAGHYSESGLEPCVPCPLGSFQEQGAQTECVECPTHLTTKYRASSSRNDCIVFDACEDYCLNGGECVIIDRNPTCSCGIGYHGSKCETDIDECKGKPCLNGGECINTNGSFYCNCSFGFEGDTCGVKSSVCEPSPCLNNATSCVEMDDGTHECICSVGYAGTYCEVAVEQCADDLIICQNGGICLNQSCSCSDGFAGVDCSINVDDCYNVTCNNGGSCLDGLGSFTCVCSDGFTGRFCETDVDDCEDNDCHNGSLCRDLVGGYRCLCPPGWSGQKCEHRLSSDFILSFPDNSSLGNMASVRLLSSSQPLSELTVSMWVQTSDARSSVAAEATPVSYAYAKAESVGGGVSSATVQLTDNALTMSDCSDLVVYINNEPIVTEVNIADGNWHHFAFTWSSDSGEWRAYKDGHLESNGTGFQQNASIPTGGLLVLGQDQDEIGGGFSPSQTFTGNLTRLNIWRSFMPDSDIQRLCRKDDEHVGKGKVMAWPDVLEGISGDVGVLLDNEDKKIDTNGTLDQQWLHTIAPTQ